MAQPEAVRKVCACGFFSALMHVALSLSVWLLAFALAWLILSQQNFYYSAWYKLLNIEQTIITYGAQNRFGKQNFAKTDIDQHQRLFADIVDSINNEGAGLKDIYYHLDNPSQTSYPLLTQAEVQHLQDVADVVTLVKPVVLAAIIITAIFNVYLYWNKQLPVSLKKQSKYSFLTIVIALVVILVMGAEAVFYQLHEWIFADHQWFFYYQDSLMSTLMQAPNIFAPIAIIWLLLAVSLWWLISILVSSLHWRYNKKPQH